MQQAAGGADIRTRVAAVHRDRPDPDIIQDAARIIQSGGRVAFPTETVYGLGTSALDAAAIAAVFTAKGRPADNPLIVHVADQATVHLLTAEVTPLAQRLMTAFWPGPLTLVLDRSDMVPHATTAGLDTVAVRMPDHPVARALLHAAGVPIAAPSANRSGRPSPTTAAHVLAELDGRIEMVLDAGPCRIGLESTVVDARGRRPVVLRPGAVTEARLREVGEAPGPIAVLDAALRHSPGTRHRHYAPSARVELFEGQGAVRRMSERQRALQEEGAQVHVVLSSEGAAQWPDTDSHLTVVGPRREPAAWAERLYALLWEADARADTHLLVEAIEADGLGVAVLDRLKRAAAR